MTQQPNDEQLNDKFEEILTAALHGDKREVLKEQLKNIHREKLERLAIALLLKADIDGEIRSIHNEILQLQPGPLHADDPEKAKTRSLLKREENELKREERREVRDGWKDVQPLSEEERQVQKELSMTERKAKRLDEFG